MSNGLFERMEAELVELKLMCQSLVKRVSVPADCREASIATLAKRYDCAKSTIRELIYQMENRGFPVVTSKIGSQWRVNVESFDAAYDALFRERFVKSVV